MPLSRTGTLLSVNAGMPAEVPNGRKTVSTRIMKMPNDGIVHIAHTGVPGDGQADLIHHGGPDKAVCVYTYDHRPHWESRWDKPCVFASFGENFSIEGWSETDVCIGDIYAIGTAVFQVTQPRMPCFKLGVKHGMPELPDEVLRTGFTGYYYRVLTEGEVQAGDSVNRRERHALGVTVAEAAATMAYRKTDSEAAERLLAVDALASSWRESLTERVAK